MKEEYDDNINITNISSNVSATRRSRNLWLSLGTIILLGLILSGCAGKGFSDFSQAPPPQSVQQGEQQSADPDVRRQGQRLRERVLKFLFRLKHSEASQATQT